MCSHRMSVTPELELSRLRKVRFSRRRVWVEERMESHGESRVREGESERMMSEMRTKPVLEWI